MGKGDLDTEKVLIDAVRPHPKNVRQGDIGAICESLTAHGQYRAIVAQRSTGHILAGNHTWKAAKQLGWSHITTHFIDCDDDSAVRILLADNRANDLATYDKNALAEILTELSSTSDALLGTLYDIDALDELIADIQDPINFDEPVMREDDTTLVLRYSAETLRTLHTKIDELCIKHSVKAPELIESLINEAHLTLTQ